MGTETEYSMYAPDQRQHEIAGLLIARNMPELLPDGVGSAKGTIHFMTNGGLFYVDIGAHPEFCTPEVFGPLAATIVEESSIRLARHVVRAARQLQPNTPATQRKGEEWDDFDGDWRSVILDIDPMQQDEYMLRNVAGRYDAWGHHINLCTSRKLEVQTEALAPLLIAMLGGIGLFGAGRVTPEGRFHKFQKGPYIYDLVSDVTTHNRPLVNQRDWPLADSEKYRRLHITGNDTLYSPWARWLRFGSYDIATAICETDPETAREYAQYLPADSVYGAVNTLSRGSDTSSKVRARNGQEYSLVDYLEISQELNDKAVEESKIEVDGDYFERELVMDQQEEALQMLKERPDELIGLVDSSTRQTLHESLKAKSRITSVEQQAEIDTLLDDTEKRFKYAKIFQDMATEGSKKRLASVYGMTVEQFDALCDRYVVEPYPGRAALRGEARQQQLDAQEEGFEGVMKWDHWKLPGEEKFTWENDPHKDAHVFPWRDQQDQAA